MGILYNIIFAVFALFYLPLFLFKGKRRKGIGLRFGIYSGELIRRLSSAKNIWVHAVSVGEVMAAAPLISMIAKKHPDYRIVITTVTETGNIAAERIKNDKDIVLFLPFDITFVIRRVIKYIMPRALVIFETELWPNLITETAARGIKVFLVNGRISDSSMGRYNLIKPLLKNVLGKIALFLMQTQEQEKRVISLGAEPSNVRVPGNTKFDNGFSEDALIPDRDKLIKSLGLNAGDKLFIAGSTHSGEERIILSSYVKLRKEFNSLKLLIAPRHIERAEDIKRLIAGNGLVPVCVSTIPIAGARISFNEVLLLDTIGRLRSLYSIADVVFIGGSLVKRGGQNMIGPAAFARPILLGPHAYNFRDIVDIFSSKKAVLMVKDEDSLTKSVRVLLQDPSLRDSLGRNARIVVESSRGATAEIIKFIENENVFL